ncbi:MAG: aldehyde ferredoxin oxidoreductase family protein [Promethearchaeia archaeon]
MNSLIGYNGKIAYVNLTTKEYTVNKLEEEIARHYLGGTGLSAKLLYDLLNEEDYARLQENPFDGCNPLIFATGPITGTLRPSSGRYSVSGISPLTGIWGEGTSGGYFCLSLRNSGYDAIIITGKAKNPIYIYIKKGEIKFRDASPLWGKNTYKTQESIKQLVNDQRVRIATIGTASENLVRYGCILNDQGRVIGRCGMGTLMGSKRLKALAIRGDGRVSLEDPKKMSMLRTQAKKSVQGDFLKSNLPNIFRLYGTNSYMDIGMMQGDVPVNYFTGNEFIAEKLTEKQIMEEYPVKSYGCAGCTLQCGKSTIVGKKKGRKDEKMEVDGPEYESFAALGPLCGLFEPERIIRAAHKCNIYGIDTISAGVSIAFLIYLVENNINLENIKANLDTLTIKQISWGNSELILELIDKLANREGIGALLANGVKRMAEKLEVDPDLAAHVKGLEIPMHDPRAFASQALSYITCCVGANHEKCDWFGVEIGNFAYPSIKVRKSLDRYSARRREKGVINLQDLRAIDDSAVNCNFINPSLDHIIGYINAATGFGYDKDELLQVGERINNLKRLINCNLGITRNDDKLPTHVLKPLKSGKTKGVKLDLEKSLKRYYKYRGWDWDTGCPTKAKLDELNINT